MEALASFLDKVKTARAQAHRNMVVFPLLAPATEEQPAYDTLEQAMNQGSVAVREVSRAGHVPELLLVNAGTRPVLILDGEELVGAKQNRIVNTTILIPAKAELVIPVSCVEQGRWHYGDRQGLYSGKRMMYASLRAAHQEEVRGSLERGEGHRSNQGMIWLELDRKAQRMSAQSPTGAMADLFTAHEDPLQGYLRAFRLVDCQVGGVFAVNGRVVGLDCLAEAPQNGAVRGERVRSLLEQVSASSPRVYSSVGLGESIRFEGRSLSGTALVHEGKVLHLAAFSRPQEQRAGDDGLVKMQRASARRRRIMH